MKNVSMNNNVNYFPYVEDKTSFQHSSEWSDQQLQQQNVVVTAAYTKNSNDSSSSSSNMNHRRTTAFRRDSFSSSTCVTVSTEQLSETSSSSSSSLDDTSFDESCSLSSTCSVLHEQQQRRRRRRRSKNNNKLVGRRVNVPNKKNNSNSRFSSALPTTTTTTTPEITEQEKNNYIAMDCEMVGIGPYGSISQLARVALVSYDGTVLYDVHVQVTEMITDYRTHVSGIYPSDLLASNGAVSFNEARATVLTLIQHKILVGHGLKNDFAALCIYNHPWYDIRDTAKYEPFMRQLKQQQQQQQPDEYQCDVENNNNMMTPSLLILLVPKKLKTLAHDKLGIYIQLDGMSHSPIEDACAAMELYKRHRIKWERVVQYKKGRTREMIKQ